MVLYAALGVPEVWRYDGNETVMSQLHDGNYEVVTESVVFPGLTVELVAEFLAVAMPIVDDPELFVFASDWVKKKLLPLWRKKNGRKR